MRLALLLVAALLAPAAAGAAAAPSTPAPPAPPAAAVAPAPAAAAPAPPPAALRFFNRDIATLRAAYYGLLPADRAAQSAARIRVALDKGGPGAVKTAPTAEGLNFTVDGIYVFRMLPGDLDAEDGQTFEQARVVVGKRLQEAIAAAQSAVSGRAVARALVLTAVAVAALVATTLLLFRLRRWIRRRIDVYLARRLRMWEQERTRVAPLLRTAGHFVFLAIVLLLAEECLRFVFGLFPYTRPWSEQLTGYVVAIGTQVVGASVDAMPGVLMVIVIATLAHLANKLVGAVALGVMAGRYRLFGIDRDTAPLARRLASVIVWLFALAMAYPYFPGASSDAFKGVSVLVGLMLSLGASGLVGQAAGGFILTFGHVLRPGDWVRVGDVEGTVTSVGMFATRIRTPMDEDVNVPNTVLLGSVSRNYSRPAEAETPMLEISVTIGYDAPWRQVHAMLLEAAVRTPELEREPAPVVLQTALSDFYVQYSLRARHRDVRQRAAVLSALNANVQDVFNEYGVQIMSPHYLQDAAEPKVVPKARWFEPPARPDGR